MNAQNKEKELMNFIEYEMKNYVQLTDKNIQKNEFEKTLQRNEQ